MKCEETCEHMHNSSNESHDNEAEHIELSHECAGSIDDAEKPSCHNGNKVSTNSGHLVSPLVEVRDANLVTSVVSLLNVDENYDPPLGLGLLHATGKVEEIDDEDRDPRWTRVSVWRSKPCYCVRVYIAMAVLYSDVPSGIFVFSSVMASRTRGH